MVSFEKRDSGGFRPCPLAPSAPDDDPTLRLRQNGGRGTQGGIASGSRLVPGIKGDLIKNGQGSNTGKMQPSPNIGRLQVRGVGVSGQAIRGFFLFQV